MITVTWEQSVEEQGITDLAQLSVVDVTKMMRGELTPDDWGKLRRAAELRREAEPAAHSATVVGH